MKKNHKIFVITFACLCAVFLGFMLFHAYIGFKANKAFEFEGAIETVSYDEKGTPTIKLKQHEYVLNAGYNFDKQIQKGDTLKKKSNNTIYILIKKDTRKTITFDN